MPSVLIFSRDPGPTNQLVAMVEVLASPPASDEPEGLRALRAAAGIPVGDMRIVARPPGDAIWRTAGHAPAAWEGSNDAAAGRLIDEVDARLLITGADDVDEPADRALWRVARGRGIESHVLLDHPANLAQRFDDGNGTHTYPDWLYVPDQTFAQRLIAAGGPQDRIRIIGDLHHERLIRLAMSPSSPEVARLRQGWGAGEGDIVVLFASECAREMAAQGRSSPYDEVEVLGSMLRKLAAGQRPGGGQIDPARTLVVVRPHPRDAAGKYDPVLTRYERNPRVTLSADGRPDLALIAADLVVGMNSSLLYEAIALGRPSASLTGHNLLAGKSRAG